MTRLLAFLFLFFNGISWSFAQDDLTQLSLEELDSLYNVYAYTDLEMGITYAAAAAEKAAVLYGKKDTIYAERLQILGMQNYYIGAYDQTIKHWTAAKDVFKTVFGEEGMAHVNMLSDIGVLNYYLGNYEVSEDLALKVKAIRARTIGTKSPKYASSLNNLGLIYWSTGRYEEAEGLYLEAQDIVIATNQQKTELHASTVANLASLYMEMERHEEVEPLYLQTKEIIEQSLGKGHPHYGAILNNLAGLYFNLKDFYKAEQLYLESKTNRAETSGTDHQDYANTIKNLALIYAETNRMKESIKALLEAEQILLKTLGEKHYEYIDIVNSLATHYSEVDDWDKALKMALKAKSLSEQHLSPQHHTYFNSLDRLSEIYLARGQYQEARESCFESIRRNCGQAQVLTEINEAWHKEVLQMELASKSKMSAILMNLYNILGNEKSGNYIQKQYIVAKTQLELLEKHRNEYIGEEDKLRLLSKSALWTAQVINALFDLEGVNASNKNRQEAFHFAELNKSVLLANAIQTERAYSFGGLPDSLIEKEKSLQEEKSEIKAALEELLSEEEHHELQKELATVNLELSNFKTQIEKDYPKYSQIKYEQSVATFEELKPLLGEKTALIEYVVSDAGVYIFYVDKAGVQMHRQAISLEELTAEIKTLHTALSDYKFIVDQPKLAYRMYTEKAHWFYQNLLAPVLENQNQIKELVIVADGELAHLPFETFLVEMAPQQQNYHNLHYLINDYTISYDYSASLWKENLLSSQRHGAHQMLALAADYQLKDTTEQLRYLLPTYKKLRKSLEPLPNAEQEVKTLSELFEGDFMSGNAVTEAFFKEKGNAYSIIHLAMHGVLNHDSPILSALAFSEQGDSVENNFLQAYEISKMDLNAALVVLSACETGYGEFQKGNGIASLARSFMYAGVPSLVVSLWQVNDQSTQVIMQGFYQNLKDGMNKAAALRQAKLAYMERAVGVGGHPAFWSPFIQLGATEPVALTSKKSWLWYGIGVIVLLGLLIMARSLRQKTA